MQTVFIAFTLKKSSVAEFFVSLANKLSRTHRVIIFSYATEKHDLILNDSIIVLEWPSRRPTKFVDFWFLIKNIKKYKPEILIASFGAVNLFVLGGFLMGIKHRVAWYHTLTTQLEFKRILFWRKKYLYKLASTIIANSESAKRDAISAFGITKDKIEVVPNAVKDPFLKGKTVNYKIVYAGRLHRVKGVQVLLKALAIVKQTYPNIILEVVGGEDQIGEKLALIKLTEELELEKNIRFVGNQSKDYVLDAFSTAYCCIVPSYFEAFGYVVIESFSVQTPVIGSNTTGIAEIIEDGVSGLLFEPGNHKELALQLDQLLKQPEFRNKLAQQAYKRFREKYELNNVVDEFVDESIIFK